MTLILAQLEGLFTQGALAAAGAAAVALPVAIHLLSRMRRRPQAWGAMRFLLEAYRRHRQRLQLEQWLLLVVRCLILIVLGLALAGPLLGGCARQAGGALDPTGRTVHLVLDDALSTRAADVAAGAARFESIRATALKALDGLGPGDRVAVWRAGRPAEPVVAPASLDRPALRRAVESLQPRHGRSDLAACLALVEADLERDNPPADRAFVLVLSDLAQGSVAVDRPAPAEVAAIEQRAKLLIVRPMPSAANTRIMELRPRRSLVLAEPDGPTSVPVELRLQRSDPETGESVLAVELTARVAGSDEPAASTRREFRWSAGQADAVLNLDLALPRESARPALGAAGVSLALSARVDPAGGDALPEDNRAWAVVELRSRFHVAMIDDPGSLRSDGSDAGLSPRRWLGLALAPQTDGSAGRTEESNGPITLADLSSFTLEPAALGADKSIDAAMVLRPDQLTDAGWSAVRSLAERGGLVWVFMPPTDAPAVWGGALRDKLGLDWQLDIEAQTRPDPGWSLAESPAPEPLNLLSSDWAAMLQPVRVHRRFGVTVRGGADAVWLRTDDDAPLLVAATLGEGRVFLLASALDPAWTSLPAKPLFVPLLHETLRGVLGRGADGPVVSGDQPSLGRRWESVQQLALPGGDPTAIRRDDQGVAPATALDQPGVYAASPDAGLRLAVNPDPRGGDTRALNEEQLAAWLGPAGTWAWLDRDNPLAALTTEAARANLGWPLLWATLALVALETVLARFFSHAGVENRRPLLARLVNAVWGGGA